MNAADDARGWTSGTRWWGGLGLITALGILGVAVPAQAQDGSHPAVTFAEDVAPILYENCVVCHRPGSIAPMSLLEYETVKLYAPLIKTRVENRKMPPWFIDRTVGVQEFKDDRSLSDEEIATIVQWVESGAPAGDLAHLPAEPSFEEDIYEWTIEDEMGRPPDWIVPIPAPFTVPADGPNWWMTFVSETELPEDRWIQAFETKPSLEGFPVVHHAGTSMIFPDGGGGFLSEYALGKTADINPPGTGQLIKAGTKLRWGIHYSGSPDGKDRTDRTRIALWFYPKGEVVERELIRQHFGDNSDLDLPGGEERMRTDGYQFIQDNIRVTAFQPHLHNLGSRQCMEVIYEDGQRQTLSCAGWDFGWHIAYNYKEEEQPLVPKGSVIHVTSWHNNSESNPWAADTRNWVGFGQRSTDDMSFSWVSYYKLTDEEYQEAVQERRARVAAAANDED